MIIIMLGAKMTLGARIILGARIMLGASAENVRCHVSSQSLFVGAPASSLW